MKFLRSIIGAAAGLVFGALFVAAVCPLILPAAMDEQHGGVAVYLLFILGPVGLIGGAIAGYVVFGKYVTRL